MSEVDQKTKQEFQREIEGLEAKQKEITKYIGVRDQLQTQLTENQIVLSELELVDSKSVVYKQTGPVLVKQDLAEAKVAVSTRISYISTELKRQEKEIEALQKGQDQHKQKLRTIQSRLTPPSQAKA